VEGGEGDVAFHVQKLPWSAQPANSSQNWGTLGIRPAGEFGNCQRGALTKKGKEKGVKCGHKPGAQGSLETGRGETDLDPRRGGIKKSKGRLLKQSKKTERGGKKTGRRASGRAARGAKVRIK